MTDLFEDAEIISSYTLDDAIADGVLLPLLKSRWQKLSGGKPIVVTASLAADLTGSALLGIWNDFVEWKNNVEQTLPEEDRLFSMTANNGKKVWVIEDGAAFTLMYPEDY